MNVQGLRKQLPTAIFVILGFSAGVIAFSAIEGPVATPETGGSSDAQFFRPEAGLLDFTGTAIAEAQRSVLVYASTMTDKSLIALLRDRFIEGIETHFILERNANPEPQNPRFLVGWLRANRIGNVSLTDDSVPVTIIVIDGKKMIAIYGNLAENSTHEVLVTSSGSPVFEFFSSIITDSFARSDNLSP